MTGDVRSFLHCQQKMAVDELKICDADKLNISKSFFAHRGFNIDYRFFICKSFNFFTLLSLTLSSAVIISGCAIVTSVRNNSVKLTIDSGERAFMDKNYDLAKSLFQESIEESKTPWDKNRAIYNLACTKLITAKNDSQFIEAIEILMQWKATRKISMYYENPRLMIQALLENDHILKDREPEDFKDFITIGDMHDIQDIDSIVKETNQMNTRLDRLLREQDAKIKTLNTVVKKQNEKIKLLNAIFKKESKAKEEMEKTQKVMEKTIKTLKHQISELERIDQKLQDKRTTE